MRARAEGHHTLIRRVFERIRNEVAEDLIEQLPISDHRRDLPKARLEPSADPNFGVVADKVFEHVLRSNERMRAPQTPPASPIAFTRPPTRPLPRNTAATD